MHPASFRKKDLHKLIQAVLKKDKMNQIKYARHFLGTSLQKAHSYYDKDLILDCALAAQLYKKV